LIRKSERQLSESQEKIDELNQKLSVLKEKRNELDAEARNLMEKRDKLNGESSKIHAEIKELKTERDSYNTNVRELKLQRTELEAKIAGKIEEIKKLREETRELATKRPSKSLGQLQKEIEGIEWKIQTTPMNMQDEKKLVEQVQQLGTQLNIQRKIQNLNARKIELQAELKALQTNRETSHEKLIEIAQQSQKTHEKMLCKVNEAKQAKAEADSIHQLFLNAKEKSKPINREIEETLGIIGQLKNEIRTKEAKEKKKDEQAILEKLEKQAREKLKRGEKLTWEEFQLLVEKGLAAED